MNFFLKNLELKILALFSAIILWFFVVGIENNSFHFPEQLEVHPINIAEDLSVSNDLGKATIRIRAPQDLIKNLTKSDFDVSVDLKNLKEGEYDLPLVATSKNDKVTILKVEPIKTHVIIEALNQKDIKLKAVVSGNPAKGYSVSQIQFTPATVTVHGGKTLLNKITDVEVAIKLNGTENANFNVSVPIQLPKTLENLTLDQVQATATLSITANQAQKTVVVSPHLQGNAAVLGTSKLLITPQNIMVQGDDTVLKDLKTLDTEATTYDALKASTIPLKVKLILPAGVSLVADQPSTILLSLTKP